MRLLASRLIPSFVIPLLWLVVPSSWAGGEIVEPGTGQPSSQWPYEVCRASVAGIGGGRLPVAKKATWYFSGVMARGADHGSAFGAFVAQKYGVQVSSTECSTAPDVAAARKIIDGPWQDPQMANYQDYVDTGWTPAGTAVATPQPAAESSKSVTFDCGSPGGSHFSVVGTYYFPQGRRTPVRVTATLDGKTTELRHDRDDASGWLFGGTDVSIAWNGTAAAATVYRGANPSQCVARTS